LGDFNLKDIQKKESVACVVDLSVNYLLNLFFLPKSFFGNLIEFPMTKTIQN
jgi:hypothetical protein